MALYKINDFDPNYLDLFDKDIKGFDLYSGDEKVGSIDDLLVDEQGRFRYFVINTGIWVFGKKVLLPIGQSRLSYSDHRVYVDGLTHAQVENLPKFEADQTVDYEHEEQVRNVYRPNASSRMATDSAALGQSASLGQSVSVDQSTFLGQSASLDQSAALEQPAMGVAATNYERPVETAGVYDRDTYSYDRDPHLYDLNEQNHQNLKLYEERLVANKTRQKTGEVAIGKHIETETAHVSVPIEKERVVIERITPANAGAAIPVDANNFNASEVARIEVYEETPDVHKEAFVREEVRVRKEVDQTTVNAEETLRKEQLDINSDGTPVVEGQGFDQERRI